MSNPEFRRGRHNIVWRETAQAFLHTEPQWQDTSQMSRELPGKRADKAWAPLQNVLGLLLLYGTHLCAQHPVLALLGAAVLAASCAALTVVLA